MYQFFETICVENGKCHRLNYHQKRINQTFAAFYGNIIPFDLNKILSNINIPNSLLKLRFLYNQNEYHIEIQSYTPPPKNTFKIVECNSIEYSFKKIDRSEIELLFSQRENCDDVIIVKNEKITDTSIANLVFFDGKEWITPATPLLKGTHRQYLIDKKLIKEQDIHLSDLYKFISFFPINAMLKPQFEKPLPIKNIIL